MSVQKLHVHEDQVFQGGRRFGATPYRQIRGIAEFEVNPNSKSNASIVDLAEAVRDDNGFVGFAADFCLLRPEDPDRANGQLLFVVANRGRIGAVPFSEDLSWPPREDSIDPGDGFLLERGWTIAWCGWQFDVTRGGAAVGLSAPPAIEKDQPIPGQIRVDFRSDVAIADHALGDSGPLYTFASYRAADIDEKDAVLTVRDYLNGPRQFVERSRWRFAHDEQGVPIPDDNRIWLAGGFEPFRIYEVLYTTKDCWVVGTGLLGVRDFVSYLRRDAENEHIAGTRIDNSFAFGASQSGRFLRHFLYLGLNRDETGHAVFDGVLPHIAGGRLGEFNQRYGQPSHFSYSGAGGSPPFSPSPGSGLFDVQRSVGCMPKVVMTNSSWEYWRGDAALNHIDPTGPRDLPDADDVCLYLIAGTDHLGDNPLKDDMPLANPVNHLSGTLLLRAAFMNLVAWVGDGTKPPVTRVPRIGEDTATVREEILNWFKAIPGVALPDVDSLPVTRIVDHGPRSGAGIVTWPAIEKEALTCYVSQIDADGNEIAGIRLPELEVPKATHTGWNPRVSQPGLPDVLYEFPGSTVAFARTETGRLIIEDPRPSLAERYEDEGAYLAQIQAWVDVLVRERFLLTSDAERCIQSASTLL